MRPAELKKYLNNLIGTLIFHNPLDFLNCAIDHGRIKSNPGF